MEPHHKKLAAIILAGPKADGEDDSEGGGNEGLETAAEELIASIKSGDAPAVAVALKSAFEILEASPHEEEEAGG